MAGVEDITRLHAMVEANRQAERDALLADARLRIKSVRVVTVDYYFHVFNLFTFWLWMLWAALLVLTEPVAGVLVSGMPAWFAVRVYRYIREDWDNIKRDLGIGGRDA